MNDRIKLIVNDLSYQDQKIVLIGLGGVGGAVLEALVRSGIKNIDIYDFDIIEESNLNRQIISNYYNVGKKKTLEAIARSKAINPLINIQAYDLFIDKENINDLDFQDVSFVIDCIDKVDSKMAIIKRCQNENIPIISSMGTGNKLDPSKLEITDIYKTSYCPLAKIIRKRCKEEHIKHLTCLYSKELRKPNAKGIGTMAFVPMSAGLMIASFVIRSLMGKI